MPSWRTRLLHVLAISLHQKTLVRQQHLSSACKMSSRIHLAIYWINCALHTLRNKGAKAVTGGGFPKGTCLYLNDPF